MQKIEFYVRTKNGVKLKKGYKLQGEYTYGVFHESRKVFRIAELGTGLDCTPKGLTKVKEFEEHITEIDDNVKSLGDKKYKLGVTLLDVFIKKTHQIRKGDDKQCV